MGYFKGGEYIESEYYEEPIYETDPDTGERRVINNEKLNPDIFDAEGNNLGKADANAKANAEAWAQHERRLLEAKAKKEDLAAEFKITEGKGIKRAGKLSFGNEAALKAEGKASERATGTFDTNRLVL